MRPRNVKGPLWEGDERYYLPRREVLSRARKNVMNKPKRVRADRGLWMSPASLRDHPRRCWEHSPLQIALLIDSLKTYGCYRNVVVAQDDTLLCGHAVVEAAREMSLAQIPVVRLPLDADSPLALRLLLEDNELSRLAGIDENRRDGLLNSLEEEDTRRANLFREEANNTLEDRGTPS